MKTMMMIWMKANLITNEPEIITEELEEVLAKMTTMTTMTMTITHHPLGKKLYLCVFHSNHCFQSFSQTFAAIKADNLNLLNESMTKYDRVIGYFKTTI